MNKSLFIPFLLIQLFFIINPIIGYSQIHVSLIYPSTFQFVPNDLWNTTINNQGSQSQTIYLIGSVKDNSQNVLIKVTSLPLTVPPGIHYYTSSTISTASVNYYNNTIQQAITKSGQFPSGSYVSCIDAYSYSNNTKLDGSCVENNVEIIHPPHLVYPSDQQVLDNAYPVLEWTPASPLRPGEQINYQIKVVELIDSQPPSDGIARNEAFYQSNVGNTLFLSYSYNNLPFDQNKIYAWQVTASIEDYVIGSSEVWSFVFKPKPIDSATIGLTDNYLLLNGKTDGGYYMANGCVKFRINDQYNTGVKFIKLLTSSNVDITPQTIPLKRPFNDDRYVVDLRNINDIQDKNYYLMQVNTRAGQAYTIRFKYSEPASGQ